jgi:hypothetical protein
VHIYCAIATDVRTLRCSLSLYYASTHITTCRAKALGLLKQYLDEAEQHQLTETFLRRTARECCTILKAQASSAKLVSLAKEVCDTI